MRPNTFDNETIAGIVKAEIQIHGGDKFEAFKSADRKARELQSGTWMEVARILLYGS
jgi:hypothetical protein